MRRLAPLLLAALALLAASVAFAAEPGVVLISLDGTRPRDVRELPSFRRIAGSDAPEGRTYWTMQLLADTLVELHVVDTISDETVRRRLKKIA